MHAARIGWILALLCACCSVCDHNCIGVDVVDFHKARDPLVDRIWRPRTTQDQELPGRGERGTKCEAIAGLNHPRGVLNKWGYTGLCPLPSALVSLRGGLDQTSDLPNEVVIDRSVASMIELPSNDGFGQDHSDLQISSKKLQRGILKLLRFAANRLVKRVAVKEKRKKIHERRFSNEEERREQRRKRFEELQSFFSQRDLRIQARGTRLQRVAIDIGYPGLMTDQECSSLASQISYCHGANTKAELPLDLTVVCSPTCRREWAALVKFNPQNWNSSRSHGANVYQNLLTEVHTVEECVYLTADAESEVTHLDPAKVYVVGGLVDRNRHKGAAARRAESLNIATARLPIDRFVEMTGHSVLTVNHVVHLVQCVSAGQSWAEALREVLPQRKRPVVTSTPSHDTDEAS